MDELEAIIETSGIAAVEIAATAMAERGARVHPCPNCRKPMIGAYCAICGQERDTHRRSLWGLVRVLVQDIVSFDSRIMRTGWALVTKPGELALAFREGRTQRYLPALRLYLFTSLIFFLLLGVTNIAILQLQVIATPEKVVWVKGKPFVRNPAYDPDDADARYMPKLMPISAESAKKPGGHFSYSSKMYFFAPIGAYHSTLSQEARDRLANASVDVQLGEDAKKARPGQSPAKRKPGAEKSWMEKHIFDGLQRIAADPAALNGSLTTWIPRVLFLLLPLYALLLELFYIRQRKKFYYVDHLIFSLTIHTFGFVLLMLAAAAAQVLSGGMVALGTMLIAGVYTLLATRRFYQQSWFWTVVKFTLVTFFYTCFCLLPALGAVLILGFLNV